MPEIIYRSIVTPVGLAHFQIEPIEYRTTVFYAVFCRYNDSEHCFHMGYNVDACSLEILDLHNCPNDLQEFEDSLSNTIEEYYV